jgi:hypothetical protein
MGVSFTRARQEPAEVKNHMQNMENEKKQGNQGKEGKRGKNNKTVHGLIARGAVPARLRIRRLRIRLLGWAARSMMLCVECVEDNADLINRGLLHHPLSCTANDALLSAIAAESRP